MLLPYVATKLLQENFVRVIINVMVIISMISLVFWVGTNLSEGFHQLIKDLVIELGTHPGDFTNPLMGEPESLIIFTYENARVMDVIRNPGPFHEPGAFAVYLILALNLNLLRGKDVFGVKNLLFVVSLLSTFSSSGFIALFLTLSFNWLNSQNMNPALKSSITAILVLSSLVVFYQTEFLGEKVLREYQIQTTTDLTAATSGRFLGATKALYVVQKYPLYGRGILSQFQETNLNSPEAYGYGFPVLMAKLGIPFGLLFFLYFYRGYRYLGNPNTENHFYTMVSFLSLLAVLFAQSTIESPLFFSLFFFGLLYKKKSRQVLNK